MTDRRQFLKTLSYGGATLALYACGGGGGGKNNKSNIGSTPNQPVATPSSFNIPPLIDTTIGTTDLMIQKSQYTFLQGLPAQTFSYNTANTSLGLLGPTLLLRKGITSSINYINQLDVTTTAHQHGLHVEGIDDGGPQASIPAGQSRTNNLAIDQPAGLYWYHPHPHGNTGTQVIHGLAGLMIIEDPEEISRLPNLPREYGVNDIPVIIQDRSFNTATGEIIYAGRGQYGKRGYLGDNIQVNGQSTPTHSVPNGWIRLRILDGSNARFYERGDALNLSNGSQFHVIASDGGLLRQPVATNTLPIGPGERYEIMLQLQPNQSIDLMAGTTKLFTLKADNASFDNSKSALPNQLATIPAAINPGGLRVREFLLGGDMTINGKRMDMARIDERVALGATEIWRVHGKGAKHTFHVHGCSFQVLSRSGGTPPAWEQGWKDTVIVSGKRPVDLLVTFHKQATDSYPFMYHCHMLEHEDMGMMGQFTVL